MRKSTVIVGRAAAVALLLFAAVSTAAKSQGCGFVTREQIEAGHPQCATAPTVLRPLPLPEAGTPRLIHPSPAKPRIIYPSPPKPTR